jgi:small subunit ribosomal protein S4
MGNPRKHRRKYSKPLHPWQRTRIEQEKEISKNYGMKNKKEIWKIASLLHHFKKEAKRLAGKQDTQSLLETKQLKQKLENLGIASKESDLNQVLDLTIDAIMSRRLQTIVYKRGLARTSKQARQFITHGHIMISDQKVTTPSYMVNLEDEPKISFSQISTLQNPEHPERIQKKEEMPKKPVKESKDKLKEKDTKESKKEEKLKKPKEMPKEKIKEEAIENEKD